MIDRQQTAEARAKAREVLRFNWQDKLSPEEIADRIGLSLAAVYRILHNGIKGA